MNNNSNFAGRRHLSNLQGASAIARTGSSGGFSGVGFRLKPVAQAVLLTLLGASPLAMAVPGDCTLTGSGAFDGNAGSCVGSTGSDGAFFAVVGSNGDAGGAAGTGSGFDLVSSASFFGGNGGAGGDGGTIGGLAANGGTGISGDVFTLVSNANIQGGAGGDGGNGLNSNSLGRDGANGGAGVLGNSFTLTSNAAIAGGNGGAAGWSGADGGSGSGGNGGAGVSGNAFTLTNNSSITGGNGGLGGSGGLTNGAAGSSGIGIFSSGGSTIYNNGTVSGGSGANAIVLQGSGNKLILRSGSVINGSVQAGDATVQVGDTGALYISRFITGDFTLGSSGVFSIAAQSNNDEGGFSYLNVSGTANVAGKAFVNVASVNTLADGQTLSGVLRTGTLNGDFTQVDDNSALFNFTSRVAGNNIDFDIQRSANTSVTSSAQANGNNPALGAARVLDQIIAGGGSNPGMQQVVTALGQLETEEQVSNAASQTLPLLVGSSSAAFGEAAGAVGNVLQGRMGSGRSSGEALLSGGELWLQPFGTWADQDSRDGVAGFEVNTYGLVFGGDAAISEQTRLGLALAYAGSQVDGDSRTAPNSADMDIYQLIGYGSHDFDAATQLTWQVDYGQGRTDGEREILFMGTTAKSNYDSQIAHVGLGLSHSYSLGQATELVPTLRADYTWIKDESYREKGAGALNLDVDSRTTDSLILGLDGELQHTFNERLMGMLKLGVGYDVIGEQATITSAYSGEPGLSFTTQGLDPSPWLGRAGMGLEYRVSDTVELSANYDASFREDFLSHTASLNARWAF